MDTGDNRLCVPACDHSGIGHMRVAFTCMGRRMPFLICSVNAWLSTTAGKATLKGGPRGAGGERLGRRVLPARLHYAHCGTYIYASTLVAVSTQPVSLLPWFEARAAFHACVSHVR